MAQPLRLRLETRQAGRNLNGWVGLFLAAISLILFVSGSQGSPRQSERAHSDSDLNAIGKRDIGKSPNFYSIEKEIELGRSLAQQVEQTSHMINDPSVIEYMNHLIQLLALNSDARTHITIRVINSEFPNALFLPGGFLFINTGLILHTENEAELAGMLAHGIAHVALRSATGQATKSELAQSAIISENMTFENPPNGIAEAAQSEIPVGMLKLQRDAEYEADYFGLQYLYKSGYDPDCFIRFIERTWTKPPSAKSTPALLSTHPPASLRVKAMTKEVTDILPRRDSAVVSTSEFDSIRDRVRQLQLPTFLLRKSDQGSNPQSHIP